MYFKVLFTVLLSILFSNLYAQSSTLKINELMASNSMTLADTAGNYEDWIELYNYGTVDIDLAGFFASDNLNNLTKHAFPLDSGLLVVPAGGYIILWASGDTSQGPLHLDFSLSGSGEAMSITAPDSVTVMDSITFGAIPTDVSYGRYINADSIWRYYEEPTPGLPNTTDAFLGILEPPVFSHEPGFYGSSFQLAITHPMPGVEIRYSLDGSKPDSSATLYNTPLSIADKSSEPNVLSLIPTNYWPSGHSRGWNPPLGLISKGTALRLSASHPDYIAVEKSASFFVFPDSSHKYSFPVFSIITESDNLFGFQEGIYVPGVNGSTTNAEIGNFRQRGIEWERPASIEFFGADGTPEFSQRCGLRIHGGYSRIFPQKSLRVYARNQYENRTFNYQLFPESSDTEYRRFILRNSGNDWNMTMFRDGAAQSLVRHFNMDTQLFRPTIVFINGEYWGIHNMRERYDRHYLERVYGVDPNNVDILTRNSRIIAGDSIHYTNFLQYLTSNNPEDSAIFEVIKTYIDIDNYMDYNTAQVYYGNTDWPYNNIDYWRYRVPYDTTAPVGKDGRYRWLLYDVDRSLGYTSAFTNMITRITSPTGSGAGAWSTLLMRELLKNQQFKDDFINRMADHLNTSFKPSRVIDIVNQTKSQFQPEIVDQIQRWRRPTSMNMWNNHTNNMVNWANARPNNVRTHIRNYWGISSNIDVTVNVSHATKGYVKLNSLDILETTPGIDANPYPWTGVYFHNIPVTLTANAYAGYAFSHWTVGQDVHADETITLSLINATTITAYFSPDSNYVFYPEPYAFAGCPFTFAAWDENAAPATFPEHMAFVYMDVQEPGLSAEIDSFTYGAYNLTNRTRINGLGQDGISFINTGNEAGNPGYPGIKLGGALLALNTTGIDTATLFWTAGTVAPNTRHYNLRLQYRIGDEGAFSDLLDGNGNPIEYERNATAGHEEIFGPIVLPGVLVNKPYVQLFWRYYFTGTGSGARDQIRLDNIMVLSGNFQGIAPSPEDFVLNIIESVTPNCDPVNPDGAVSLAVNGGTTPYTFQWSHDGNLTSDEAINLAGGNYSATVTDALGCVEYVQVTLPQSIPQVVDMSENHIDCHGDLGSAEIDVFGGSHPLYVAWSTGQTDTSSTKLVLWDFNDAVPADTPQTTVGTGLALLVGGTVNPETGTNGNGSSDPTSGDNLAWQTTNYPAQNTAPKTAGVQFNISTVGYNHLVFTFDQRLSNTAANTWVLQYSWDVSAIEPVWVDATSFAVIPQPQGTGDTWYNGRSYDFSAVTALNNNPYAGFRIVSDFDAIAGEYLSARSTSTYAGGTARFDMVQLHGHPMETVFHAENLSGGIYTATITDGLGCLTMHTIEIDEPDPVEILSMPSPPLCHNSADGMITILATGGTEPYEILWSTGETGDTINGLETGTYWVEIQDAAGCTITDTIALTHPNSMVADIAQIQDISCFGAADGILEVSTNADFMPVTFEWSDGSTTSLLSNLQAGNYSVTVTDGIGCTAAVSFGISEPDALLGSLAVVDSILCNDDSTGSLQAQVTGGTEPHNFLWNNGHNGDFVDSLPGGLYFLSVSDANDCFWVDSIFLMEPPVISLQFDLITDPECHGFDSGIAHLSVSGGSGILSVTWSDGHTGTIHESLHAGTHYIYVEDENNCTFLDSLTLSEPDSLEWTIENIHHASCHGEADGSVEIKITGGTEPYNIVWDENTSLQTGFEINNLNAGEYSFLATDANDCEIQGSITIEAPDSLEPGDINGNFYPVEYSTKVYSLPEVSSWTYEWEIEGGSITEGQGSQSVTVLWGDHGDGSISVTVTDDEGCSETLTILLDIFMYINTLEISAEKDYRVFPNPARNTVFFHFQTGGLRTLQLYNAVGVSLKTLESEGDTLSTDLHLLPAGSVFYHLTHPDGNISTGVIIVSK